MWKNRLKTGLVCDATYQKCSEMKQTIARYPRVRQWVQQLLPTSSSPLFNSCVAWRHTCLQGLGNVSELYCTVMLQGFQHFGPGLWPPLVGCPWTLLYCPSYAFCFSSANSAQKLCLWCGAWWLRGKFCALRPEGCRFESHSNHHAGTLGKSFTHCCL